MEGVGSEWLGALTMWERWGRPRPTKVMLRPGSEARVPPTQPMPRDQVPWLPAGPQLDLALPLRTAQAHCCLVACSALHGGCNHQQQAHSSGWVQASSYRLTEAPRAPQQCCALCPHPRAPCRPPQVPSSPGPFSRVAGVLAGCVLGSWTAICTRTRRHQNRTGVYCISVAGRPDPGVYMGWSCPGVLGCQRWKISLCTGGRWPGL